MAESAGVAIGLWQRCVHGQGKDFGFRGIAITI